MDYAIYLSTAATIGDIDAAIDAVKHGADVNQHDGQALIDAIKAEDMAMVQTLIALGANVNQQQHGLWGIPLKKAAERGNIEILTYLLDHGADRYDEAIGAATALGKTDILRTLKDRGIALQVKPACLTLCLKLKQEETALFLVQNGQRLTEAQVLTALHLGMHQVINHLTYNTDYLPTNETHTSLMGSEFEWFLHGIANRELNKTLNRVMAPRAKDKPHKI